MKWRRLIALMATVNDGKLFIGSFLMVDHAPNRFSWCVKRTDPTFGTWPAQVLYTIKWTSASYEVRKRVICLHRVYGVNFWLTKFMNKRTGRAAIKWESSYINLSLKLVYVFVVWFKKFHNCRVYIISWRERNVLSNVIYTTQTTLRRE